MNKFPSEPSVTYLIHEVARIMKRRFEDQGRAHGLTLPQWRALAEIYKQDGISQVSLAGCIDTDPMTLSGVLDRLDKRGLIERYTDPNDSRAKLARLTPSGAELVDVARSVSLGVQKDALAGLSAEDRAQLAAHLNRIRENLNNLNMIADQKETV